MTFEEALTLSILWACYITWRDWFRNKLYERSSLEASKRQQEQYNRYTANQVSMIENIRRLAEQAEKDAKHETTVG